MNLLVRLVAAAALLLATAAPRRRRSRAPRPATLARRAPGETPTVHVLLYNRTRTLRVMYVYGPVVETIVDAARSAGARAAVRAVDGRGLSRTAWKDYWARVVAALAPGDTAVWVGKVFGDRSAVPVADVRKRGATFAYYETEPLLEACRERDRESFVRHDYDEVWTYTMENVLNCRKKLDKPVFYFPPGALSRGAAVLFAGVLFVSSD